VSGNTTVTVQSPYTGGPPAFDSIALVNVKICRDVPTTFGRVIGFSRVTACGSATARKAGVGNPNPPGGGTNPSDFDAPCAVDSFIPGKYIPGGDPGGVVKEGNTVGAWFGVTPASDPSTLDQTVRPPTFLFNGAAQTGITITPKANTTVKINGVNVVYHNVYEIKWKIPSGLANNAKYTVQMAAFSTDTNACGKAQWSFIKGQLNAGGTSPCEPGTSGQVEDAFLGSIFPAAGTLVHPGDQVGAVFQDESPIYNGTDADDPHKIIFQIDGRDIQQGTPGTTSVQGPNTVEAPGSTSSVYTLHSPTALITTNEKYSTDIQYKLPTTGLASGGHTVTLKAWDTDSNKAGGDCGVATWSINFAGSDVELVQ